MTQHQKELIGCTYRLVGGAFPIKASEKAWEGQLIECPFTQNEYLSLWGNGQHYICMNGEIIKQLLKSAA